jgi:hypothetical protein
VKMAKASEADQNMAMDLTGMLDALGHRFCPSMPQIIARNDGDEPFDIDDAEQCQRALRALLETAEQGSLMRVTFGCAVMLDPRNKLVDPASATIEHHPDRQRNEDLLLWSLYHHQGGFSPVGQPIRNALGIGRFDALTPEQIERAQAAGNLPEPPLVPAKEGGAA